MVQEFRYLYTEMYCSLYSDGLCTTLNITWTTTVAWFPPNGLLVALQNRQDIKKVIANPK